MLPRAILARVFLRSLLLQGSWNSERMQSIGLCFALAPALDVLCKSAEERSAAMTRHLEFYNSHPFMAAPILGALIKLESEAAADRANGNSEKSDALIAQGIAFKNHAMGPLAALGDGLFWQTLKPAAFATALLVAFLAQLVQTDVRSVWLLPAMFVGFYAGIASAFRLHGFLAGLRRGPAVVLIYKEINLVRATEWLRTYIAATAGAGIGLLVEQLSQWRSGVTLAALTAATAALATIVIRWGARPLVFLYASAGAAILLVRFVL